MIFYELFTVKLVSTRALGCSLFGVRLRVHHNGFIFLKITCSEIKLLSALKVDFHSIQMSKSIFLMIAFF